MCCQRLGCSGQQPEGHEVIARFAFSRFRPTSVSRRWFAFHANQQHGWTVRPEWEVFYAAKFTMRRAMHERTVESLETRQRAEYVFRRSGSAKLHTAGPQFPFRCGSVRGLISSLIIPFASCRIFFCLAELHSVRCAAFCPFFSLRLFAILFSLLFSP